MFIPARTCLLWGLGVISILAGWQGVSVSAAFSDSQAPAISSLRNEAISGDTFPAQPSPGGESTATTSARAVLPYAAPSIPSDQDGLVTEPWPLGSIRVVSLPSPPPDARPVLVAVLDTGIDDSHTALTGKVAGEAGFVEGTTTDDYYGHGTAVAGIIVAEADTVSGTAGLAPDSRLLNIKVADDRGKCVDTALAEGIIWAADNGASVINISIEMKDPTARLEQAIEYAWEKGAVIIAAAGNDGNDTPVYPAAFDNCLSVTAVRQNGDLAPLANYGDWVDVTAPGFEIYTTLPGDEYGTRHGTSFAAAYVSGLAALLFPRVTDLNGDGRLNDEVLRAIMAGSRQEGIAGTQRGIIDVAGSLALASSFSTK